MECVITDASLRGAQQEEEQADAAEPGSTEGDPGGNTHTHTGVLHWLGFFMSVSAAAAAAAVACYQTATEAPSIR